jgi:hypothetical protein
MNLRVLISSADNLFYRNQDDGNSTFYSFCGRYYVLIERERLFTAKIWRDGRRRVAARYRINCCEGIKRVSGCRRFGVMDAHLPAATFIVNIFICELILFIEMLFLLMAISVMSV